MSKERFISAVGEIGENVLERYDAVEQKLLRRALTKKRILRLISFAACICVFAGMIFTAVHFGDSSMTDISDPLINTDVFLTAEDIASIFPANEGSATSSYRVVYAPNKQYFAQGLPEYTEYRAIYQMNNYVCAANENEFRRFADDIIQRFGDRMHVSVPEYKIQNSYKASFSLGEYNCFVRQNDIINSFTFFGKSKSPIDFGGKVTVDQTQSDEDIIKSLEKVKKILFDVFDTEFSDVEVNRIYDNSKNGVSRISVLFYNASDSRFEGYTDFRYTDYIGLYFQPVDRTSYTLRFNCENIYYQQYRCDPDSDFSPYINKIRQITLNEAEELLRKGYVFGGHSCPICMSEQAKVDFENYDHVNINYLSFERQNDFITYVPFYAFYKEIGVAENGNIKYAVTYVPAVEIAGYEEYFESQKKYHS